MSDKRAKGPLKHIESLILILRGQRVMLSADLAELYGVEVKVLNQAVKRHTDRFPEDFMFQLTWDEVKTLTDQSIEVSANSTSRSQSVTLKRGKNIKYRPYAFSEQGVAMLSSVLNSSRAVSVNIEIMRAFVRLRKLLASHEDLARKLDALEKKYDSQFKLVFDAIRQLMVAPDPKQKTIGFVKETKKK